MYDQLAPRQLIASLRSTRCLACGGAKNSRMTFCGRDYHRLSQPLKRALYARVGEGYEQAVREALAFLEVSQPALPAPVASVK